MLGKLNFFKHAKLKRKNKNLHTLNQHTDHNHSFD